ncbi:MAG: glucose-6-phosphate dehydrogenase, partial [Propionibacterium acidifaciens]
MTAAQQEWVNPLRDPEDGRLPHIAGPCALVFFGVSGDLSRKKLLPAVYDLANRGLLPPGFGLVGVARRDYTDARFAEIVKGHVKENARTPFRDETWKQLVAGIRFVWGDFDDGGTFERLRAVLDELDTEQGTAGNHAFYLSVPPSRFERVIDQLTRHGMTDQSTGWKRVVIEKPFGHDLASSRALYDTLSRAFPAESVFRIDHYLGKETV